MFTSGETDKEILSVSGFLTGIGSHCRVVLNDFCGEFSSVDGTTIYIGGSDNRQKSVRGAGFSIGEGMMMIGEVITTVF